MNSKGKFKTELLDLDKENIVKGLESCNIEKLGSDSWFEAHRKLQLLLQQAVFEAQESKDEHVKDLLVLYGKLPVLLQEALCISVWKEKVLPLLLRIKIKSTSSVLIPYLVMYHEGMALSLLETVLFYPESCDAMGGSCNELIEYCITYVSLLLMTHDSVIGEEWFVQDVEQLTVEDRQRKDKPPPSPVEEILQYKKKFEFEIGVHCFTILSFLAQNLECLPLNAAAQLFEKYDVPLLFVRALLHPPWIISNENDKFLVYVDTKWKILSDRARARVIRIEAQVWIALRQLMLNPQFASFYEITTFRRNELIKVYSLLVDTLIDQIPPLGDLKIWLGRLMANAEPPPSQSRPLIVEVESQVKSQLSARTDSDWKRIAKAHATCMTNCPGERIQALAKKLSGTYDLESFSYLDQCLCAFCGGNTKKRCSRCKEAWYCSRDCQVKDWSHHKAQCVKIKVNIKESKENKGGKTGENKNPVKDEQSENITQKENKWDNNTKSVDDENNEIHSSEIKEDNADKRQKQFISVD